MCNICKIFFLILFSHFVFFSVLFVFSPLTIFVRKRSSSSRVGHGPPPTPAPPSHQPQLTSTSSTRCPVLLRQVPRSTALPGLWLLHRRQEPLLLRCSTSLAILHGLGRICFRLSAPPQLGCPQCSTVGSAVHPRGGCACNHSAEARPRALHHVGRHSHGG